MKFDLDAVARLFKIVWGSSLLRLGMVITVTGLGTLTGIAQYIVEALFAKGGVELRIPENSVWVGWVLIAIGIGVAVYGSHQQLALQRPPVPNPHDVANLARLRGLVHPELQFFREHNFGFAFDRRQTDKLDEFVHTWVGANNEFVNGEVQRKLVDMRVRATELAGAISTYTYAVDTNPQWATVNPGFGTLDADRRAEEAAQLINAAATTYVSSVDDFERIAKVHIV